MKMVKAFGAVAAAGMMMISAPAWSATTVNLSATDFAQSSVTQTFAAGDYVVSFLTGGLYKAWAPATPATAPDGLSGNWEDRYATTINGVTTQLNPFNGQRFATADAAFTAFKPYTTSFTLTAPTAVTFSIPDFPDSFGDNSGGVSLSVSAVPETATWMMMIVGFGGIGTVLRGRARRGVTALAAA